MRSLRLVIALFFVGGAPAMAQQLGKGGTGVDEAAELPHCVRPMGTVALVENKTAGVEDQLPPGLRALLTLADRQNGGGAAKVDPLPVLRLLTAQSGCFQVVERGEGFDALQRERTLAAGGSVENGASMNGATLKAADYLLQAQILYSDAKSRESGGAVGTLGSAIGLKSKTLESQTMLTLVDVRTGIQKAVATGAARKRDISVVGGGLLLDLGVGALGGTYTSTDIGKITSLALLDAYRKLAMQAVAATGGTAQPARDGLALEAARPASQ